jgi:hypothetical protein
MDDAMDTNSQYIRTGIEEDRKMLLVLDFFFSGIELTICF